MKNPRPTMTFKDIIENDGVAIEERISIIWQVASMMDFLCTHLSKLIVSRIVWAKKTTMIPKSQDMEKSLICLHFINTGKISKVAWIIASLVLRVRDQDATHLFIVSVVKKVRQVKESMDTHQPWASIAQMNVVVTLTYLPI